MTTFQIQTNSHHNTIKLAKSLATLLKSGDVLTLEGDLGAGKTTFTKGLAEGLDIQRAVTSPTFTMMKQYEGTLPLYHIDAYRLEHSEEDIGFDEYIYGDGITVIEWASFIEEFIPQEKLEITIRFIDEQTRGLSFHPVGDHYEQVVQKLINAVSKGDKQ